MKCHEAKRRLDPFMDGELAVPENLALLEHLNLCRACADVFEGEKRLRGALKEGLAGPKAPAGLRARLAGPGELVELPRRRWGMLAAAALFFLIVGSLVFTEGPGPQLLASELSERHAKGEAYACGEGGDERRCLCRGCTAELAPAIQAFFARHAERDYCAHLDWSGAAGYVFEGVAAWRCREGEVFWSTWRTSSGGRVSHALVSTGSPLRGPRLELKGGRPVVFYPRGDAARPELACVFVFDQAAEAERFIAAVGLPRPR